MPSTRFPTRPTRSPPPPRWCATPTSACRCRPRACTSTTATACGWASGAFELWPQLGLEDDAAHAFYMGVELAHAEIAWRLGKRYVQDQPLDWGCAVERASEDLDAWCAPGTTMHELDRPSAEMHAMNDRSSRPWSPPWLADGRAARRADGRALPRRAGRADAVQALDHARQRAGHRPCGAQYRDRHARVRRLRDRPPRLADAGRPNASPACAWPARSAMSSSSWPSSTTTRSARCCAWRACTR